MKPRYEYCWLCQRRKECYADNDKSKPYATPKFLSFTCYTEIPLKRASRDEISTHPEDPDRVMVLSMHGAKMFPGYYYSSLTKIYYYIPLPEDHPEYGSPVAQRIIDNPLQ